jgi:hypothetical protein
MKGAIPVDTIKNLSNGEFYRLPSEVQDAIICGFVHTLIPTVDKDLISRQTSDYLSKVRGRFFKGNLRALANRVKRDSIKLYLREYENDLISAFADCLRSSSKDNSQDFSRVALNYIAADFEESGSIENVKLMVSEYRNHPVE